MIDDYKMPIPLAGQTVLFYPDGDRNQAFEIAQVLRVANTNRSIELMTVGKGGRSGVRHVTDPRLEQSETIRRDCGAWDFDGTHYQMQDVIKRVEALEAATTAPFDARPKK